MNPERLSDRPVFRIKTAAAAMGLAAASLLTACGSSSSTDPEAPPPVASNKVPASATVTVSGYTQFVSTTVSTPAPDATAIVWDVSDVTAPTSESAEPSKLN
jgi:hypothetical protein